MLRPDDACVCPQLPKEIYGTFTLTNRKGCDAIRCGLALHGILFKELQQQRVSDGGTALLRYFALLGFASYYHVDIVLGNKDPFHALLAAYCVTVCADQDTKTINDVMATVHASMSAQSICDGVCSRCVQRDAALEDMEIAWIPKKRSSIVSLSRRARKTRKERDAEETRRYLSTARPQRRGHSTSERRASYM